MSVRQATKAARVWRRTWIGATMIGVLVGLVAWNHRSGDGFPVRLVAVLLSAVAWVELRGMGLLRAATWPFGVLLGAWVLGALLGLHRIWADYGTSGLVSLLLLAKVGDIAGYYVGNAIGRTHPFPGISPGKTTAGCVGSLVAGTVVGSVLVAAGALPQASFGLFGAALGGALVNVAAQAGDLAESWIKRRTGVKDSGVWFGPAGGVLDLVDSLLLCVPAALLIWPLLFSS